MAPNLLQKGLEMESLVNTIIVNTKGEGAQATEDFWVKAEKLYYTALGIRCQQVQ